MKSFHQTIMFLTVVIFVCPLFASERHFTPFVIPAQCSPNSEIQFQYSPIAKQDRLSVNENHFYSSRGRVRLWGVNFSFEANFPSYSDAKQIAERLAKAGINAVRLHHMDTANWPRGIWNADGSTLCPEAIDRLDYFIDQLAIHGIYVDLNLHVGKEHSKTLGLPESPENYDKMASLFVPQIIEAQKIYARRLLEHQNKYRPWRYADDPAIAIVEITNENSLFMWSAPRVLPALPPFYANILQEKYNRWLKAKYGTTEKLAAAWYAGSTALGDTLLSGGDFENVSPDKSIPDNWRLEQHDTAKAEITTAVFEGRNALCIRPAVIDGTDWHLQFSQGNLSIRKGQGYTVELQITAAKERPVTISIIQAHSPWKNLGLYKTILAGSGWKQVRLAFTATEGDDNARINVVFGNDDAPIYLAGMKLQSGADFGPGKDESIEPGTVRVFGEIESEVRQLDRLMFLAETEKTFFDAMRNYLKKDLSCRAMITGTIVFGPLGLYAQSDMDFIDAHAYWQHPRFPHKSWDPNDWFIEQKAMTDYPAESTLIELAAERLAGKPFTVTEYNHPAPSDSQAECVPMIASFAAAQDWDGVWLYTYSHSNDNWGRDFMNSYFDVDTNPAKWGFVPAGAAIFRFDRITAFQSETSFSCPMTASPMENAARLYFDYNGSLLGYIRENWRQTAPNRNLYDLFTHEIKTITLSRSNQYYKEVRPLQYTKIDWNVTEQNEGVYFADSAKTLALTGHSERFSKITDGMFQITSPSQASITITPLDNKQTFQSSKILIVVCGRCENTGMQFSADRRTVGKNWGKGPVRIEPVEGIIDTSKLFEGPYKEADRKCFALNPDGTKKTEVPIAAGKIEMAAKYGTMWYLIEK
jgi:hypothetical protein